MLTSPDLPAEPLYKGWYHVGFVREDSDEITPATIGQLALILVRRDRTVRAFDAHCPHRGAHLGYGGRVAGEFVVCPFHGRRIALGDDSGTEYCVREYQTVQAGTAVFVLLRGEHENGLGEFVRRLAERHWLIAGFTLEAAVPPSIVIENAVDADHFHTVHGIERGAHFVPGESEHGELAVDATFPIPGPNPWQDEFRTSKAALRMRFSTRVFSPNVVATELGNPPASHVVFTSATPTPSGGSVIRVTLATPRGAEGAPPDKDVVLGLLRDSRTAFEQDMVIWEHLATNAPCRYGPGDWAVADYRRFCERFV